MKFFSLLILLLVVAVQTPANESATEASPVAIIQNADYEKLDKLSADAVLQRRLRLASFVVEITATSPADLAALASEYELTFTQTIGDKATVRLPFLKILALSADPRVVTITALPPPPRRTNPPSPRPAPPGRPPREPPVTGNN